MAPPPSRAPARPRVLGVELVKGGWLPRAARVAPGTVRDWMRVPVADAGQLVLATARVVADLPRGSSGQVVWTAGTSELLVHTDRITMACNSGLVTIGLLVECDQVDGAQEISVPLAVGTEKDPRGLFMSTFQTPGGPAVVTATWSAALTAYAWECVLTLASQLSGAAGTDDRGRPLVPAALGAAPGVFLVRPMARG